MDRRHLLPAHMWRKMWKQFRTNYGYELLTTMPELFVKQIKHTLPELIEYLHKCTNVVDFTDVVMNHFMRVMCVEHQIEDMDIKVLPTFIPCLSDIFKQHFHEVQRMLRLGYLAQRRIASFDSPGICYVVIDCLALLIQYFQPVRCYKPQIGMLIEFATQVTLSVFDYCRFSEHLYDEPEASQVTMRYLFLKAWALHKNVMMLFNESPLLYNFLNPDNVEFLKKVMNTMSRIGIQFPMCTHRNNWMVHWNFYTKLLRRHRCQLVPLLDGNESAHHLVSVLCSVADSLTDVQLEDDLFPGLVKLAQFGMSFLVTWCQIFGTKLERSYRALLQLRYKLDCVRERKRGLPLTSDIGKHFLNVGIDSIFEDLSDEIYSRYP